MGSSNSISQNVGSQLTTVPQIFATTVIHNSWEVKAFQTSLDNKGIISQIQHITEKEHHPAWGRKETPTVHTNLEDSKSKINGLQNDAGAQKMAQ